MEQDGSEGSGFGGEPSVLVMNQLNGVRGLDRSELEPTWNQAAGRRTLTGESCEVVTIGPLVPHRVTA